MRVRIAGRIAPDSDQIGTILEQFRVAVVEITHYTLEDGNTAEASKYGPGNNLVMDELMKCRARNVWPTRYEGLIKI